MQLCLSFAGAWYPGTQLTLLAASGYSSWPITIKSTTTPPRTPLLLPPPAPNSAFQLTRSSCATSTRCTAARFQLLSPSRCGRYKLEYDSVDLWFRVMRKRRNVYLWLVDAGGETKANFMLMAKKAGVASSRIIFGERADFGQHIQVFSRAFAARARRSAPRCRSCS